MADRIKIGGRAYPFAGNYNVVTAFLKAVGRDTLEGLTNIGELHPSEYCELIAAAVNEGLRLEKSDIRLTAEEIGGAPDSFSEVPAALSEIFRLFTPGRMTGGEEKKKDL